MTIQINVSMISYTYFRTVNFKHISEPISNHVTEPLISVSLCTLESEASTPSAESETIHLLSTSKAFESNILKPTNCSMQAV